MGSEADDILDSLSLTIDQKKEYGTVTKSLTEYFIPKRNVLFERVQFNQRVQLEGENVDSFVTGLHKLAEYCAFGALHNDLIRDRLVVGLRDHKLSEKLQLDAELTLEKALAKAKQHEAVRAQQPVLRGHKSESVDVVKIKPRRSNKGDKKSVTKTTSQQQQCKRCGRDNHPRDSCPTMDAFCHKCSVRGHWARVCLSKPKVNGLL